MNTTLFSKCRKAMAVCLIASVTFAAPAHAQVAAAATSPSSDAAFRSIFAGGPMSTDALLANHVTLGEAMVAEWASEQQVDMVTFADANVEALASLIGDEAAALDMSSNLFLTPQEALAEVKANGFNLTTIDTVADLYNQFAELRNSVDGQVANTAATVATAYGASWTPSIDFSFAPPEALSFGLLYDEVMVELVASRGETLALAQNNTGDQAFIDSFNVALLQAAQSTSLGLSDLDSPCLAAFNYAAATGAAPTDPGIVEGGCTPCVSAGTFMHQKLVGVMDPSTYAYGDGSPADAMADMVLTQAELDQLDDSFVSQIYRADALGVDSGLDPYWSADDFYAHVHAGNCVASTSGVSGAVNETLPVIVSDLNIITDLPTQESDIVPGSLLSQFFPGTEVIEPAGDSDEIVPGALLDTWFPGTVTTDEDDDAVASILGGGLVDLAG